MNSNIRCIEIQIAVQRTAATAQLNSNIRCIEIEIDDLNAVLAPGWIVTLDVLKWISGWTRNN